MTQTYQRLWTLEDYQGYLKHSDPLLRYWAMSRIEEQYPSQAAESFVGLLTDPDPYLQSTAARAIMASGDNRYEPALTAVFPESEGFVRNWFMSALGKLRSPALLPHLLAELENAPAHCPPEPQMLALRSVLEALGYYPDEAARSALWQFVEHYREDDRLTYTAFEGLLRFADPATLPRLIQRYGHLRPRAEEAWQHALIALAQVVGIDHLTRDMMGAMLDDPEEALWLLDEWFEQDIVYSESFEEAFYERAAEDYAGLLPHILTELEQVAAAQGDDLPAWLEAWRTTERPNGYRWRMLYTHQVLAALAKYPPSRQKQYQEAVALGLVLLGQARADQNDEAILQSASNELIRQATLLNILASPRQNVMPDVITQVAALGPGVVPHLIDILTSGPFWAVIRALAVLTEIARAHPGEAEAAILPVLNLINADQSDYILEPAVEALLAIGPGVIAPAAARLGLVDYVYDIYVSSALSNIPTAASAWALLSYIGQKQSLEEYEAEALSDLGHAEAIPFLRDNYDWSGDPILCTVLYKLALLNDYTGPELAEWQTVALDSYADFVKHKP